MRYLILAVMCCGCLTSEHLAMSQACIAEHASRQAANMVELARLTRDVPITPRMAELVRETADSAGRVTAWIQLTQSDIGRAEAPPEIMTSEEIAAQAVYRQRIELRNKIRDSLPIDIPGIGGRESNGLFNVIAGGGPFAVISTVLGLVLKKKHGQEKRTRERGQVAHAAVLEAMDLIRTSPDPQLKKRAAKRANLVRMYADQKLDEYETRAMAIERGAPREQEEGIES